MKLLLTNLVKVDLLNVSIGRSKIVRYIAGQERCVGIAAVVDGSDAARCWDG
jgi:hypothetical protein